MKKNTCFFYLILFLPFLGFSQKTDSTNKTWTFNAVALFNIIQDDFFITSIVNADKNKLHLESRYNYEDIKTVSFFGGYNFTGGNKIKYRFTPILGVVLGNTDGIAPGLKIELTSGGFRLYSEMEYVFNFNEKTYSFYFNWSELTYSPKDWFWVGITGQRTRIYANDLDIQRGFLAGLRRKNIFFIGYLLNPFTENTFGILGFGISF
jgi:hypothetical protein